jgi:putative protease
VASLRIEARRENPGHVLEVTGIYRRALDMLKRDKQAAGLERFRERLEALSPSGITKGHYYRGV